MGGDTTWQASYSDPLRVLPDGAPAECKTKAVPQVEEIKNECCSVKFLMMHRPTHDAAREKSGEYPLSWHLADRKRLWELRLQIQFSRPPDKKLFFGVELDRFVPVSGMTKQAQKALVSTCQRIVGDCYHTLGDDLAIVQGELEAPAFVMPLWAFDQFHVAELGNEPPLTGNLNGLGLSRAEDGVSKYINAMKAVIANFSTDKVYTFCFWGISQFLDIFKWEVVGGIMPGLKMDFNKLCGSPPVYFTIYELPGVDEQAKDQRHLASRKRQYFRAAVWSMLKPPENGAPMPTEPSRKAVDLGGFVADDQNIMYTLPQPGVGAAGLDDLLGLCSDAPVLPAKADVQVDNADLLGLF
mmetsp:Transcript_53160/g.134860  ORF Transcript_53160/g.134860 Transcript_53160/m.134860 type:complete len:354 (+) Transcript_53160:63-1124(+)